MNEHLRRAQQKQERALAIVRELGLMERWSRFGSPVIVGAVRYGLVVNLDIDMEIYCDEPSIEHGFSVMSEIAHWPNVWQITFANELQGPDQGLYWQIRYREPDGAVWKMDNWLVAHNHPDAHWCERFAEALEVVLSDEDRQRILEIKEEFLGDPSVRGVDVYQAVIEGGVRDMLGFTEWRMKHPPAGMNYWLPGENRIVM